MIENPMDVLAQFPVRKSKKQKQAFREAVQSYVRGLGYESRTEKGSMGAQNIVIGDPETAQYLVTAHYDTPAGMLMPNFITPGNLVAFLIYQFVIVALFVVASVAAGVAFGLLIDPDTGYLIALAVYWAMLFLMLFGPANRNNANDNTSGVVSVLTTLRDLPDRERSKVCFVLFDLEEAGLVGSAAYRKAHKKQSENQIVLNMDCVGDGDEIVFFPNKKLKKNQTAMDALRRICGSCGAKSIAIREKGFAYYPSDQRQFPLGVGIAAFRRGKLIGLYLDRIHTRRDTILEEENVNVLSNALIRLICNQGNEDEVSMA